MEQRLAAFTDSEIEEIWIAVKDSNVVTTASMLDLDRYQLDYGTRKYLEDLPLGSIWSALPNESTKIGSIVCLLKGSRRSGPPPQGADMMQLQRRRVSPQIGGIHRSGNASPAGSPGNK